MRPQPFLGAVAFFVGLGQARDPRLAPGRYPEVVSIVKTRLPTSKEIAQLVALMRVTFRQGAPGQVVGLDLAREYETVAGMSGKQE